MNKHDAVEILLVEDNPNDAEIAIRALKKHNLSNRVIHVVDGEEALNYIFGLGPYEGRDIAKRPKVILLDLKLPKVDGLEVLKAVKNNESTKMIPVVILTSSQEESDLVESYKLGVNSYLVKPVDFDKFASSIKDIGFYWLILNKLPGE